MSEKYRNGRPVHNEDNENTRTTVIPPEARQQYRERYQQPQEQYYQQPYQQQPQGQPYQQPYQQQPQGQPYQKPYQQQPQEQYYQQTPPPPPPQMRRPAPKPQKQKKKKRGGSGVWKFFKRFFYTLLILFILLFGIYSCTSLSLIRKLDYVPTQSRERTSGAISRSYVTSVLLIGTDGRSLDERGRSDTMMLVSVNSSTKKICTTSFMRDCYVEIPGYAGINSMPRMPTGVPSSSWTR